MPPFALLVYLPRVVRPHCGGKCSHAERYICCCSRHAKLSKRGNLSLIWHSRGNLFHALTWPTEKNLNFLTERLLTKLQQDVTETQNLKTLEKALAQTNKSLSNLLKAIENGIFSDTTKTRLDELETQKKALTEKLLIEKNKERSVPTADEIKKYLKYAIQKTPRNLVELLVDK